MFVSNTMHIMMAVLKKNSERPISRSSALPKGL